MPLSRQGPTRSCTKLHAFPHQLCLGDSFERQIRNIKLQSRFHAGQKVAALHAASQRQVQNKTILKFATGVPWSFDPDGNAKGCPGGPCGLSSMRRWTSETGFRTLGAGVALTCCASPGLVLTGRALMSEKPGPLRNKEPWRRTCRMPYIPAVRVSDSVFIPLI